MEQKHLVAFAVIAQAYWTLNVDGSNFVLRGDIAPPEECLKIDKSGKRERERGLTVVHRSSKYLPLALTCHLNGGQAHIRVKLYISV